MDSFGFYFTFKNVPTVYLNPPGYLNVLTLKERGSTLWIYKNRSFTSVEELFCFGVNGEVRPVYRTVLSRSALRRQHPDL
jgi:hypothetical protein